MPKPKKQAKNEDGSSNEEYKNFDEEMEKDLDGDAVADALMTDDDFNPEDLGIDKNMDSYDDHDLF